MAALLDYRVHAWHHLSYLSINKIRVNFIGKWKKNAQKIGIDDIPTQIHLISSIAVTDYIAFQTSYSALAIQAPVCFMSS